MHLCILALAMTVMSLCQVSLGEKLAVEVYYVVDDKVVESYMKETTGTTNVGRTREQAEAEIRKDADYYQSEINKIFASLASNKVDIEVRQIKLEILKTNVFSSSDLQNGNQIQATAGLNVFENWLTSRGSQAAIGYDCAVLWTGFDIVGPDGPATAGFAPVGKMCDQKKSLTIVEHTGTYFTVTTTAHELGHVLGANHDGAASDYVMAGQSDTMHKNRWEFSGATASEILQFIAKLPKPNCLQKTSPSSVLPKTTVASYNGLLLDPTALCRRQMNNAGSYMMLSPNLYENKPAKGDQICQHIFCAEPGTTRGIATYTSEGMICDKNKRCSLGKCQPDTSPASGTVDADCPFGDQAVIMFSNSDFSGTCAELVTKLGNQNCLEKQIAKDLCCKTCARICTGPPDCKCGDLSTSCVNNSRERVCPTNKQTCCGYCKGFVGKRSISGDELVNITLPPDLVVMEPVPIVEQHFDELSND